MLCRRREISLLVTLLCTVVFASGAGPAGAQTTGGTPGNVAADPRDAPSTGGMAYGDDPARPGLSVRAATLLGRTLHVRGSLSAPPGRRVIVQRLEPGRGWREVASARMRSSGRFVAAWRTDRSGRFTLRAVPRPRSGRVRATRAAPSARVAIFPTARATWYGPGLFGRTTACGQVLAPDLVGVAHRSLPCGTLVEVLYGDRTTVAPVVDRGPFSAGVEWDLTEAAAGALGFTGADVVGIMRVR